MTLPGFPTYGYKPCAKCGADTVQSYYYPDTQQSVFLCWAHRPNATCQHCGVRLVEGPTELDRERFERGVCGGCQ